MPKLMRFYLKVIGESISIYHRASHQYLESADSFEEAAEMISSLNDLTPDGLWRSLMYDYKIRLPHRDVYIGTRKDSGWTDSEESYNKAWKYGTEKFYAEYPDLLVEEDIPYDLLNQLHYEHIQRESRREQKEKEALAQKMQKERVMNSVKVESTAVRERAGRKQIVIRVAHLNIALEDQDSPFA